MKILVFAPYYPPHIGGLENYADELNKQLAKEVGQIIVFTPRLPIDSPSHETWNNIEIMRFPAFEIIPNYPIPKLWSLTFWKSFFLIHKIRHDIVISHTRFFIISTLPALIFSKFKKTPWIHIEHGSDFVQLSNSLYSGIAKLYDLTLGKLAFSKADAIVSISKASAKFIKTIQPKATTKTIYRGFSTQKIDVISSSVYSENRPIILYFGRLISGKGVADLIYALSRIKNEDFSCLIAGDGPEFGRLQDQTKKLNLEKQITFLGKKSWNETMSIVKSSDIVINPSYTEGLPTSLIEAALCKKAIIATNVGGTNEIIKNNESGFLVPARDIEKLSDSIRKLIKNEDLRMKMGENARTHAIKTFDWEKCISEFTKIINQIKK